MPDSISGVQLIIYLFYQKVKTGKLKSDKNFLLI